MSPAAGAVGLIDKGALVLGSLKRRIDGFCPKIKILNSKHQITKIFTTIE
jgi:hypothetical protein